MSNQRKLLVVEDDEALRRQLRWSLESYAVLPARDRDEALALLRQQEPDVVLLDLGLPPDATGVSEGFAALEAIRRLAPATKIVVMTGQDSHEHAVRAVGSGAYDFHTKPVDIATIGLVLERAFQLTGLERAYLRLLETRPAAPLPGVIGDSPAILRVCRMVEKVAPADVSVVLLGESGTGKEVIARALHGASPRRGGRFVAINCAAIPPTLLEAELFGFERGAFTGAMKQTPGKLELAHGGTLFLDEIGDLPLDLQAKLLRFLQERVIERVGGRKEIAVDVRVLCATHRDLGKLIEASAFREDLFYRLAEISIALPPLRERIGDAVLLARHFINEYGQLLRRSVTGFTSDALRAIDGYGWPGNVRELQNRLKRAVIMCEGRRITSEDLDLDIREVEMDALNLRQVRERAEVEALRRVLAHTQGNVSHAARILGVSRPTLYDLMRQHNLRE